MRKYRNFRSLREDQLLYEAKEPYRVKCKCGHTNTIINKNGYHICSWCHNYCFINPQVEFEYRMKEKINKEKRKENGKERRS